MKFNIRKIAFFAALLAASLTFAQDANNAGSPAALSIKTTNVGRFQIVQTNYGAYPVIKIDTTTGQTWSLIIFSKAGGPAYYWLAIPDVAIAPPTTP